MCRLYGEERENMKHVNTCEMSGKNLKWQVVLNDEVDDMKRL